MVSESKNSGGAATQIGLNYQNRVAAWVCVRILAEQESSSLWNLSPAATFEFVRCETEQPVDDILVGTSDGGHIFLNVKHTIKASTQLNSPLGSAVNQFVRQFLSHKGKTKGDRPWDKELNPAVDRLVLVTRSASSAPIRESLVNVLAKIRDISDPSDLNTLIAALSIPEKEILETFRKQIANSWIASAGSDITHEDELHLLKLIWIETLDIDDNTSGEREAKNLLRASILQDSAQSEIAWDSLIQASANFASRRSGSDRALLQQQLINSGVRIKIPKSYRTDVEKLRSQSKQTLRLLKGLSTIRVGDINVKINRQSTEALFAAAEKNSVVVVGEPGAGKSGALHDVVDMLLQQNRDVIFFAVDHLEAKSIFSLKGELDLEHELIEIIKNWSDDRPAFLVIDALDAARSESAAQTFYDLISLTLEESKRWRVIISIRKFDLRHHNKLRQLFAGSPPINEFRADEFHNLCHFNVPLLDETELSQIQNQSPELAGLIAQAEEPFKILLKVPFNLRLAGELIGTGVSIESLSPIKTQIGLLDLYWNERVIRTDHQGDARQAVLLKVVEAMIRSRSLRTDRISVATEPSASQMLSQLLSSHILSEWELPGGSTESNTLTFAHHVLFDYAVSRLLFRGELNNLVQTLENSADLVLAIRPSIVMHFQHLWLTQYALFWEVYFNVIRSIQIPEITKLIGASVIVEFPPSFENFEPLINSLSSENTQQSEAAEKAFRHITGALIVIATPFSIYRLIGENAPIWCELLDGCTNPLRENLAYSVRPVLWTICGKSEFFTESQRHHTGKIASRLFNFALLQEPRDSTMVSSGIETVCKTFESNPVESAELLRKCLEPEHVLAYGHEELFRFGQEIERLMALDPDLVEEMYAATFTNYDYSEEKTYMVASRILPLTSTRRQDFHMAQYSFAQKFRKFLEIAPIHATRVVLTAMSSYVDMRNKDRLWSSELVDQGTEKRQKPEGEKFLFDDQEVRIIEDHSAIWDGSISSQNDESVQMFHSFGNYLEQINAAEGKADLLREILSLIIGEAQYAVFWRRLIIAGTKHPETLGYEIRSLAWANPILTSLDTSVVAGDFIAAIIGGLNKNERNKIEQAILEIPNLVDDDRREYAEHKRNRLLGCLNKDFLVSREAKEIIHQLEAENKVPPNEPPFKSSFYSKEFTDEDYLREEGVSLEDEPNRRIFELSQPGKNFAAKHQNIAPTAEEFIAIIPHLRALYNTLNEENTLIHEKQRDLAWSYLADACSSAVDVEDWSCESEDNDFIKNVLLECASYPDPVPSPNDDKHFDDHPLWGSAARVGAASGLIRLARHESCVNAEVLATIESLALRDQVPAVRFQIAIRVTSLYDSDRKLMWHLLETISSNEQRSGILKFLVNGPLNHLAGHHPDEISKLTKIIFERVLEGEAAKDVKRYCTSIFTGLYLWRDHKICEELVNSIVSNPATYNTEAHQIVFDLRSYLNLGLDDFSNKEKEKVRVKAFHLIERVLATTAQNINSLEKRNEAISFNSWTEEDQETGRNLAHLAESTCSQIYFASGAYGANNNDNEDSKIPMGAEARKTFFEEAKNTLELLSGFGYAGLTHHLLETIEFFAPHAPKDIFLMIAKVVRSGKQSDYQYEQMAADLVVKLVERFIAEFRFIFQEDEECRHALIEILNIFVEAGWATARRLTYRMEEIFR